LGKFFHAHKLTTTTILTNRTSPSITEGTIIIEIGPDRKRYYVHRALLVHHSEYFAKALQGSWKEAQEGVITLEDIGTAECK
jgi:multisubunit Na+/H+ antiporter MnhE subunit